MGGDDIIVVGGSAAAAAVARMTDPGGRMLPRKAVHDVRPNSHSTCLMIALMMAARVAAMETA